MARSSSDSFWNWTRQAIEIRLRDKNVPLITKKNSIAICLMRTLSLDAVATAMRALATWRGRGRALIRPREATKHGGRELRNDQENMVLAEISDGRAKPTM